MIGGAVRDIAWTGDSKKVSIVGDGKQGKKARVF